MRSIRGHLTWKKCILASNMFLDLFYSGRIKFHLTLNGKAGSFLERDVGDRCWRWQMLSSTLKIIYENCQSIFVTEIWTAESLCQHGRYWSDPETNLGTHSHPHHRLFRTSPDSCTSLQKWSPLIGWFLWWYRVWAFLCLRHFWKKLILYMSSIGYESSIR